MPSGLIPTGGSQAGSSTLGGQPWCSRWHSTVWSGGVQPYPVAVVGLVAEAAGGAFHLFDGPVGAFGGGVGDAGLQEHQDRRPPPVDGFGQCGDFGDVDGGAPVVEGVQPVRDLVPLPAAAGAGEQGAQLLFGDPGG